MHFVRHITTVDTHTEGEPTRIITGGLPVISGNTMLEKKKYMRTHLDNVRSAVMNEPRGHHNMFGAVLTEYVSENADIGLIFMDGDGYLNMCGHSSIGALTVAIETGIIPAQKPYTKIIIDTPIGQIEATAKIDDEEEIEYVSIKSIPSFVYTRDIKIETENFGQVSLDVAFGGSFVALVDISKLDLATNKENAEGIIALGMEIKEKVNKAVKVKHPLYGNLGKIEIVELHKKLDESGHRYLNIGVFGHAQLDRCPCGTGICAKMASLFDRKALAKDEEFVLESIIGTKFTGRILGTAQLGQFSAIIPEFSANAYITGFNQIVIDPYDPVKYGFRLG